MIDKDFILEAINLGQKNLKEGGQPYGAVVVKDGKIIGTGVNKVNDTNDPIAHAEILAIQDATKKLNSPSLEGCKIYASNEPCAMCLAAIYWVDIKEVFFAISASPASKFIYEEISKPSQFRTISIKQLEIK